MKKFFTQLINKNWEITCADYKPMQTDLPASLYSELLKSGQMEDPYYRENEYWAREISRNDCIFSTDFTADDEILSRQVQQLVFYGIDTIADVKLNGSLILRADNMHRTWRVDVTGKLQKQNTLEVYIKSPIEYIEQKQRRLPLWNACQGIDGFAHIRKGHYMFGWDWGPQLPDMGIFRSVELAGFDGVRLSDVSFRQVHKDGRVTLNISAACEQVVEDNYTVKCTLLDADGVQVDSAESAVEYFDRNGIICESNPDAIKGELSLQVEQPRLWWPNGLGEQYLYTLCTQLIAADGTVLDQDKKQVGLRTMTVSTKKDCFGAEFCYVINGHKMFAMGGNYIPEDNILSRTSAERCERMIKDCARANYNSIRVWGGGYYPDDWFYDLCDRYGLIVWQDCMFACASYYLSAEFRETVQHEIVQNITRIRNHACLGILSGNNEMEVGQKYWHDVPKSDLTTHDYIELFERLIRQVCDDYAPDTFFWPSSPSSGGGFVDPGNYNVGDTHYWDVWTADAPFEVYRHHYFRFCSEFGFQGLPSIKTIESFTEQKDRNLFSSVMESHQKLFTSNKRLLAYLVDHYLYPKGFNELIYGSQVIQADAIRYGVEHWRRHRGRCMGALYWQVNDCWPVVSWASLDYFGRWKALHYAAKRFFAPVLLSAHDDGVRVVLNVSNEQLTPFKGEIRARVADALGNAVCEWTFPVQVNAMSALDITTLDLAEQMNGHCRDRVLVFELYNADGSLVSSGTQLFAQPKHFEFADPHITAKVSEQDGEMLITLNADAFARYVELDFDGFDAVLSDNFFDICGNAVQLEVVETSKEITAEQLQAAMIIRSVYDMA